MTFDTFESTSLDTVNFDLRTHMSALQKGFDSSIKPQNDVYTGMPETVDRNISHWLGINMLDASSDLSAIRSTFIDSAKQMYHGIELENGGKTLGLEDISKWGKHPDYMAQNIKQHAGYAAEVISTTKENLAAKLEGSGIQTYRADDRPDLYAKNDQYVDKIRVNNEGEIIERIQVKFVGNSPEKCLSKMMSSKYDKYFNDGKVDKMEVPKDFYDKMKELNTQKMKSLEEQIQHVKENGNQQALQTKEGELLRRQKIDHMLEKSTVTSDEAVEAVKHPRRYTTKLFAGDTFKESHKAGMETATIAVTITAAVSTVDNFSKVMDGEISPQEAFVDVATDTGKAGGIAYGTAFVSTAVSNTMSSSSHQLIKSLGSSNIPATAISFGVQSFDSIIDYANGTIDGGELAYDLGENAASIGGSIAGSAAAGAAVGSIVPGAGTAVGFTAGLVGGMVGCAVASEAYSSIVEFGGEHAGPLAEKAQEMASRTVDIARDVVPDKAGAIVDALNNYAVSNNLPFRV